ncbi:hypothetical protein FO519_006736 [Halicephalobus sp. NKZ332]|nr:hypothetical protein FO519_006736 [Halicephalobus sp. NKZ332]
MSSDEEVDFTEEYNEPLSEEEIQGESNVVKSQFKVLEKDQVRYEMEVTIENVKSVTNLSAQICRILLHQYHWNEEKLIEKYSESENVEEFFRISGLEFLIDLKSSGNRQSMEIGTCMICHEETQLIKSCCDHYYCTSCLNNYLSTQLHETLNVYFLCPGFNCNHVIDNEDVIAFLKLDNDKILFQRKLINDCVENNKFLKYCPASKCDKVIKLNALDFKNVTCECGNSFCFNCSEDWHEPITCFYLKKWKKQCQGENQTLIWITTNTKNCPQCHVSIEKNGGCDNMGCIACGWEKYLKKEIDIKIKQISTIGFSLIETQFFNDALQILHRSQQILMYSCAFAFYLKPNSFTSILEIQQTHLEAAICQLKGALYENIKMNLDELILFKQGVS